MASSSIGTGTQVVNGDDEIPNWVSELSSKHKEAIENVSSPCYIYKVPSKLRVGGADKFEPRFVSIGPYHITKKNLEVTENIKEIFLLSLISRTTTPDTSTKQNTVLINMWKEISKLKTDYLKYYSPKPDLEDEPFVKMLVLDGCFIIELLYRYHFKEFQNNWLIPCLQQDLVLLENQIPFSVLTKLFDLVPGITIPETGDSSPATSDSNGQNSSVSWQRCFELFKPGRGPLPQEMDTLLQPSPSPETSLPQEMDTLLQPSPSPETYSLKELILQFFDPILPTRDKTNTDYSFTTNKHLLDLLRTHLLQQDGTQKEVDIGEDVFWEHTTCATDLHNAGVIFKKKDANKSLLDITFSNETLEIPPFYFGKSWAILFLNMIALEQCRHDYSDKITSYAILMDNFINSSDDVKLLREKSIIYGSKEEDKTIADIVNNLSKEAIYENFHYDRVCSELNKYRKKKVKRWRAAFYESYIHTPWAGISLIGALILLILALIQTVFTILSWKLAYDDANTKK